MSGGRGCLCVKMIEGHLRVVQATTHWQATVITDSKSLLISLQPDC